MARSLTIEEKNKIKNLQVSNSIYKREIKTLIEECAKLKQRKEELEANLPNLLGDEYTAAEREINEIKGQYDEKVGKIAYKDSKINEKDSQIEEIKNIAAREDEPILASIQAGSPEAIERWGDPGEVEDVPALPKKNKKDSKKNKK